MAPAEHADPSEYLRQAAVPPNFKGAVPVDALSADFRRWLQRMDPDRK